MELRECPNCCGRSFIKKNGTRVCEYCDSVFDLHPAVRHQNGNEMGGRATAAVASPRRAGKAKNKTVAFLLCLLLGYYGAHKFYEGKIGMGLLYLFTGGLCGIGWIVDCIVILTKPNPYYV